MRVNITRISIYIRIKRQAINIYSNIKDSYIFNFKGGKLILNSYSLGHYILRPLYSLYNNDIDLKSIAIDSLYNKVT